MTDRPTEVWIGPHRFEILYDEKQLGLQAMDDGQAPAWGHLSWVGGTIVLDPRRPESGIRESLLHEILHGVWDVVGLPNAPHALDGYLEETVIKSLAATLTMVLRMNPTLLDYMTASNEASL